MGHASGGDYVQWHPSSLGCQSYRIARYSDILATGMPFGSGLPVSPSC